MRLLGPACVVFVALACATAAPAQVLRWSPDGKWIANARHGGPREGVSLMRSDGSGERYLRGSAGVRSFWLEWSPDSRHLAFGSTGPYGGSRLMISSLDRPSATLVTAEADNGFSWSPDSRLFAYSEYMRVYPPLSAVNVIAPDGSGARRVVAPGRHPDWSPDGTEILFTSVPDERGCSGTLEAIRPDGTGRRVLSASTNAGGHWSPAGDRLVYSGGCGNAGLRVVRRDGSGDRRVPDLILAQEPWSPDGRWLAGTGYGGPLGTGVVLLEVDGTRTIHFPTFGGGPVWSPRGTEVVFDRGGAVLGRLDGSERRLVRGEGFAWSPDGSRLAFLRHVYDTVDARRCGQQAFVLSLGGGGVRPVGICPIRGTFDVDAIDDTAGSDEIQAFGGDDEVWGGSGDDQIAGGRGNDRIGGGSGRDTIRCGPGRDVVTGARGDRVAPDCELLR